MAEWWDKKSQIPLDNDNFQEILKFYLFQCPAEIEKGSKKDGTLKYEKVSKQAISLRQQGWVKGNLNTLRATMKNTTSGHLVYQKCKSADDIAVKCLQIEENSTLNDDEFEMIIITERSDMNLTNAIFYYIRNAFAHCSFSIDRNEKNVTYYLESSKEGKIKARIRLREQTLLKWIKDFQRPQIALKTVLSEKRKKQKQRGQAA